MQRGSIQQGIAVREAATIRSSRTVSFSPETKACRAVSRARYYKAFAPRIGLAWSPGWTEGWLAKLTGGPGRSSVRAGYGIFYNPIEQLVMEQFSAEPPFGGSTSLTNTLFNLPFEPQSGGAPFPNPSSAGSSTRLRRLRARPTSRADQPGCVDWAQFRPILLAGEFQPHLKLAVLRSSTT